MSEKISPSEELLAIIDRMARKLHKMDRENKLLKDEIKKLEEKLRSNKE